MDAADLDRAFRSGLKFSHLRMLVALARLGAVGKVAEAFNVTQPAISKQLGEIEAMLGMPVVTRAGRRIALTPVGEVLVKYGRQILHSLEDARREVEALGSGLAGTLRVGAVPTVMPTLVAAGVARFRRRAPAANLTLKEGTTDLLFPLLAGGELDLVVSRTRAPRSMSDWEEEVVGRDPIVVVCSREHPLAARRSLRWKDLAGHPWALPPEGSAMHDALRGVLERHRLLPGEGGIVASSIAALPRLIHDGYLIGLLPRAFAQGFIERRKLAALPLAFPNTAEEVRVVWRRDQATPVLRVFVQCLGETDALLEMGG